MAGATIERPANRHRAPVGGNARLGLAGIAGGIAFSAVSVPGRNDRAPALRPTRAESARRGTTALDSNA
ncbi:hypothetical protein [Burkholderia anthina]|uniref:hypothetical protein n=1 Tax=Burkholderia anthina TaxID=179879 RepID=UPI0012DA9C05|nr:hypothetical protein [Burkholderia anthina]